ncbi:MAG: hypothetical protein KKH12_10355 [Gammaproteobacteria bacterium]|nr:hypothetical protein [Gammaproteobacteria bacterium]MBU1482062.1 hypothetical protein [Gammaproteobacteria bacterium]
MQLSASPPYPDIDRGEMQIVKGAPATLSALKSISANSHYGADDKNKTWTNFTWKKNRYFDPQNTPLGIPPPMGDNALGTIRSDSGGVTSEYNMTAPEDNGDGTVPEVSGADSASKAKFKFVAKMTGYVHQESYIHKAVKDVTTYCVARIAKDIK